MKANTAPVEAQAVDPEQTCSAPAPTLRVSAEYPVAVRPVDGIGLELAVYLSEQPSLQTILRLASCSDRLRLIEAALDLEQASPAQGAPSAPGSNVEPPT